MKRRDFLAGSAALAAPSLARAQSKPEKLVFVGDNGPWHWCLTEEVGPAFQQATGIKMEHVPYKSDALVLTALLAGDIQVAFASGDAGEAAAQLLRHAFQPPTGPATIAGSGRRRLPPRRH